MSDAARLVYYRAACVYVTGFYWAGVLSGQFAWRGPYLNANVDVWIHGAIGTMMTVALLADALAALARWRSERKRSDELSK